MRIFAIPLTALALIFGLTLAGPIREKWEDKNRHARTLQLIQEQREQFDLEQYQIEQQATLPGKIAAQYGFIILLLVGGGGLFWVAYDGYRQRRTPLVRYDANNPLVARWMLEQGNQELIAAMARALELSGQAQIARAVHQPGQTPATLSYHQVTHPPRLQTVEPAQLADDAPMVERAPLQLLPGECTLAALQRTGIVARSGNSLHIGNAVADGTPIYLELATWGALALGGKSRTGKTSRITYYLAQAALNGWRLVVCDKHGGGGKADALLAKVGILENSFLLPAAVSQADINTRIRQVYTIGKRRIDNSDPSRYPVLLIVDEFTNLILNDWLTDTTLDQLMSIANEHAGVNVHAIIIGHDWSASCLGKERGAAFRRITTHRIAHRLDAAGAQFLLPSGMGKTAEGLTVGQAIYVDDTGEPILVDAPLLHEEDIRYAAEHNSQWRGTYQGAPAETTGSTPGSTPEAGMETTVSTHQGAVSATFAQREARVREMLREKASQRDIIAALWGVSGGRAYQAANDELRDILARIAGGA